MKIPACTPVASETVARKQSQSLRVKALTHHLLGREGNCSLFSSRSAVFRLTDPGLEKYLFPFFWNVWRGWLSSTGWNAFLVYSINRGMGTGLASAELGRPVLCSPPPLAVEGALGAQGRKKSATRVIKPRAALVPGRLRHAYLHCRKFLLTSWAVKASSLRGRGQMFPNQP